MLNEKSQSRFQSRVHPQERRRTASLVDACCTLGTPCLDDYEFLRTLGSGANATVYLVREKHTSHLYALKAVEKYIAPGREIAFSTVINEQAALTELTGNDFILPLHACFHDTKNFYLVTEYLPGGDLFELRRLRPFDVEAVRFYMAELLLAIEHVHAHNIVHRDIKPENVFIDADGHVVLGDFGIVRLFGDSAPSACVMEGPAGTPGFSSPEVLSGRKYGFEADLWAFGVMLYEMLSGREAFQTNTVPDNDPTWLRHMAEHVKNDELVMIESPMMTAEAMDLVSQLLRKNLYSRLCDISEIKEHPFFETIDWTSVASRSLTAPWVPRLISSRQIGVHYRVPDVDAGKQYAAGDDPLPTFTFRAGANSLAHACARRQQVFGVLDGPPLVSWVDGASFVESVACRTPERQRRLKTLSRWVKRAFVRPVRSA